MILVMSTSPNDLAYWLDEDPDDPRKRTRAQTRRLQAGISQEDAARALRIAVGTLSKRETGKTTPRGWAANTYVEWLKKLKPKPSTTIRI